MDKDSDANVSQVGSLIDLWLLSLNQRGLSTNTMTAYRRDLLKWKHFLTKMNYQWNTIDYADIQEFIAQLQQQGLSNHSIHRVFSALKQWMTWLVDQHYLPHHPAAEITIKRHQRRLPSVLDIDQMSQLLDQNAPENAKSDALWQRDKAILEVFYSSGLRLNELAGLDLSSIDWDQSLVRVLGKGNKERIVPLGKQAIDQLLQWLSLRQLWLKNKSENALFISHSSNRLSARQIQNRIKYHAKRAGITQNLHPHLLRHCFATHVLSSSQNIRAVQEMLGHQNVGTTQIYTHLDYQQLAKSYDQFHPRAKKRLEY